MSGASKAGSNLFKHLFSKYPLVSNGIIYGTLYVGAEFSQQVITYKYLTKPPKDIDRPALGRYAIMGTFIYSPILYNWYKWLDKRLPGTTKIIITQKLILDQFVLTPTLLLLFFTGMSIMERARDPFEECRKKYLPTFGRSCLFWIPAQSLNFLWVPPRFRVIYVGSCALIWVNILCWIKRQEFVSSVENEELNNVPILSKIKD